MVRTKYFNNKYWLLTSSLNYYYSLTFLRVEGKRHTYNKFIIERNRRETKISESPPPSVNWINLKSRPGVLLLTNSIHEDYKRSRWIIWKSGRTSRNITSLQAFQQDARQFGRPARAESAMKRPVSIKYNAPSRVLILNNPKVQVVWYSYTL